MTTALIVVVIMSTKSNANILKPLPGQRGNRTMLYQIWSIIAWVPLGIGLLALAILIVLFYRDFVLWYIRRERTP